VIETKAGTKFTLPGVSIGHGCGDCFKLTVEPEYLSGAGARWAGVVTFTAGHAGGPDPEVGSVSIDTDDLPELIARLQGFYDQQQQAGDSFVPGWRVG
jgi:hypothetical protein